MVGLAIKLFAQSQIDTEGVGEAIDSEGVSGTDGLVALAIMAGTVLLALVAGKLVERLMSRGEEPSTVMPLIRRLVRYVIVTLGVLYALGTIGVRVGPLLGALGIAGIALAFGLQDVIQNFIAGMLVQVRRPFVVGDQIRTGDHEGTVLDVNARTVVLDTPSGERVYLPAGQLIQGPIENYTDHDRRRTTVEIGVDYTADLHEARAVLRRAASGCEEVLDSPSPEALVTEFGDSSIVIALQFWHDPTIAGQWAARDAVAVAAKQALDEAGIGIPFPQSVVTFARAGRTDDG